MTRADNRAQFTGKAMLRWAHGSGLALRLIQPALANRNDRVDLFSAGPRDECLNEHRFMSPLRALADARMTS